MKSAEEVAELIMAITHVRYEWDTAKKLVTQIANEVTAYVEERVKEARFEDHVLAGNFCAHCEQHGAADALEEAAQKMWDCYNSGMNPSETATAIRALKVKP